jgi:hypothetical protein
MPSFQNDPVVSVSNSTNTPAVQGESSGYEGVRGVSHDAHGGVTGINDWSPSSPPGAGGNGGWFESSQGEGVRGWAKSGFHGGVVGVNTGGGFGVYGQSDDGIGVVGESKNNEGLRGVSHSSHGGVVGINDWSPPAPPGAGGNGGWFESTQGEGVRGTAKNPNHGGVVGVNTAGGDAGFFDGSVTVTKNLAVTGDIFLPGADCAEQFDIAEAEGIEPGTVVVIDQEGALRPSQQAYDKKVAGVVSGAGGYRPGIVLDRQQSHDGRASVALVGKVYCKVDAQYASIEVGDLLTTSATPGHAMRANDPVKIFGSVIGKALRPLMEGQGLIPILIALQ